VNRTAAVTTALCLALAGCGGGDDTAAAPETASPAPATSAPAASASPRECPVTADEVEAPAGSTTDLAEKPVIKGSDEPAPTTVQVADIVEGDGAEATTLSNVEVKYVGAIYETGKEFDSSWKTSDAQTLPFTVCSTGVIPGFAIAPTGMKVGGRRQVTIPSLYGYGEQGSPPTIPGGATLVFVIDLVDVTPPAG
jgi:FKBP-type peptidyl-prolyl cis-trans isomerase